MLIKHADRDYKLKNYHVKQIWKMVKCCVSS